MSLARGANYSQAGIHATLSDPFDIKDSVRLADATAGAWRPVYEGSLEDEQLKERNWQPGFTLVQAGVILLVVLLALAGIYISRNRQLKRLALDVNRMSDTINDLAVEITQLNYELEVQNTETRIDYEAIQVLGMVPQEETEIYSITAPDPRPYQRKTVLSAAGF